MRIIRTVELAEMLGISIPTLHRWDKKGILPPKIKIRGVAGYRSDEIDDLLERHTVEREVPKLSTN